MAGEDDDTVAPDVLAEAREALKRSAEARGVDPDEVLAELDAPPPAKRSDDPFAAAREALEKAARVRSELGESPRQREARVRAIEQLELLKSARGGPPFRASDDAAGPTDDDAPDPSAPAARKRRL